MANEIKKYLDTAALGTLVEQIKAEDAKVLAAAKLHAEGLGTQYDAAGAAATAESNAKAYTDALANGQVKTNKEDIATLKGTGDGSVAKAVADAKALVDADVDAVEAIANKNKEDIAAINNGTTGILAQAKGYTDDEVAKVAEDVADLDAYVGTFTHDTAKTVVEYINAKTDGIATSGNLEALGARVTSVEGDVATIKGDYLKGADKTELAGKITAVETAVATEKSRAEGIEAGLESRLAAVEGDYLKGSDKTELQGNIDTLTGVVETLRDGVDADKVDGVKDLIKYVEDHGSEVTGMQEDIAENASAIEGVAGRMTTAEGKITTLEGAVATKAEKEYVDGKVDALQGVDAGFETRIAAIEGKFGGADGSVEDMIADAKAEAISAAAGDATSKANQALVDAKAYADAEDAKIEERVSALETESAKHALASDLTALTTRVGTAEGEIDTLQSEMDAVEALAAANKAAHEANASAIALKAAQADLEAAVARIAQNETDIGALEDAVADKAEQSDLEAAVARISKNETDIAANASAIGKFNAITPEEVAALFA